MQASKMKNTKKIDVKYLKLLTEACEKYRDIDVIRKSKDVDVMGENPFSSNANNDHKCSNELTVLKTNHDSERKESHKTDRNNDKNVMKLRNERKNRKIYKMKLFLPDEDEYIKNAITNDDYKVGHIAKVLDRETDSIIWRIKKLRATGTSRRRYKHFELKEDCVLIDAAFEDFKIHKDIETTTIPNVEDLAVLLKRETNSVRFRWEKQLRVWLSRYYKKTLNLEIRPMLANILADNFHSIPEIDWRFVINYPEFSGHTDKSLRTVFYAHILPNAARRLRIEKFDLTLKQIAGDAEKNYVSSKIPKKVERRQKEIIEYFETINSLC